jgi:hypothetical protein
MTPEKAAQRLRGQSSLAQKVFHAVPSQEAWHVKQIESEFQRIGKTPPPTRHAMLGCLRCLVEAGLISEPTREKFRSMVRVSAQEPTPPKQLARMPTMTVTALTPTPTTVTPSAKQEPPIVDALTAIAQSMVELADDCRQKINKITRLASDLEDVILRLEEEQKSTTEQLKTFDALKGLLNSIKAAS